VSATGLSRRSFLRSALIAAVAQSVPMKMAEALVTTLGVVTDTAAILKQGGWIEMTFYGTGIWLGPKAFDNSPLKLSIDGMPATGETYPVAGTLVDGLPLDVHTLKIEMARNIEIRDINVIQPPAENVS
jgi:hypothetical protein